MRVRWEPDDFNLIGYLGDMLDDEDPRPAREQFNTAYAHGGGWQPFDGFTYMPDGSIQYPGDPPYKPRARAVLRDEVIIFYDHAWVLIAQPDGTFEIARMD